MPLKIRGAAEKAGRFRLQLREIPRFLGYTAGVAAFLFAVHTLMHRPTLLADGFDWIATPCHADHQFGYLCVVSNVFFVPLAGYFFSKGRLAEASLVTMCCAASLVYHGLQVHPNHGPMDICTKKACKADVGLCSTLFIFMASKYSSGVGRRVLPVLLASFLCFLVPGIMPAHYTEVAYSFMHSAWHGFISLTAYVVASEAEVVELLRPAFAASVSIVAVRGAFRRKRRPRGRLVGNAAPREWRTHSPISVPARPWSV